MWPRTMTTCRAPTERKKETVEARPRRHRSHGRMEICSRAWLVWDRPRSAEQQRIDHISLAEGFESPRGIGWTVRVRWPRHSQDFCSAS